MSIIQQEIESVLSTITPPKAIFKLSPGYSDSCIKVENMSKHSCASTSALKDVVLKSIDFHLDISERKYVIKQRHDLIRLRTSVIYSICDDITSFIVSKHPSKNPRLTSLYQWFGKCVNIQAVNRYDGLEEMLYHTWTYINSDKMREKSHVENALKVLELLKTKFEARGLKRNG